MASRDLPRSENQPDLYQLLPSINDLLLAPACCELLKLHPRGQLLRGLRSILAELRHDIASGDQTAESVKQRLGQLFDDLKTSLSAEVPFSLRPVVNATGVVLHTNLGRAPLSDVALRHVVEVSQDYCNLELDLATGLRSRRDVHAEALVLRLLNRAGSTADLVRHGVVIVNNCAAATLLALNSLSDKLETIVSRGELVEIGGGFRIPEILAKSGAALKEIGTTNRTRISDYEGALGPNTGLLLRVHQSNFSMEGFVARPSLGEMVDLSRRTGVPLFEDQGTGLLTPLERFGIRGEPTLSQSFEAGADLIAASGDKLLGGPQCGILIGKRDLIARIQQNPLLRALRVDKLTYAALEGTLLAYLSEDSASVPVEQMLDIPPQEIMRRCRKIVEKASPARLSLDVVPVDSLVGGGTVPRASLPSCAISLRHSTMAAPELLSQLRKLDPPIVGRIENNLVLLDLRTVRPSFDDELRALISSL